MRLHRIGMLAVLGVWKEADPAVARQAPRHVRMNNTSFARQEALDCRDR